MYLNKAFNLKFTTKYAIILLVFLGFKLQVSAQSEYQLLRQLTTDDGLPSNNVYAVVEDSKGFMWFATDDGIVKYDGEQMKVFTTADGLPKNDLFDLREDSKGRMWVMCHCNEVVYIRNDTVYNKKSKIEKFYINDIVENENDILFFNADQVLEEIRDSIILINKSDSTFHVLSEYRGTDTFYFEQHKDGKLFLSSEKKGLIGARQVRANRTYYNNGFLAFFHIKSEAIYLYHIEKNRFDRIHLHDVGNRKNFTSKLRARNEGFDYVTNGKLFKINPNQLSYETISLDAFNYCELPTSFVENGNFLILSSLDKGVFIFRKKNLQKNKVLTIKEVSAFAGINDSLILFGDKSGNFHLANDELTIIRSVVQEDFASDPEIRRIYFDAKLNEVIYHSISTGLSTFPILEDKQIKSEILLGHIKGNGYRDFIMRSKSNFLIRSSNSINEASEYAPTTKLLVNYPSNDFILSKDSASLFIGANKILYIYSFQQEQYKTIDLNFNITSLIELDNFLFVGTDGQGVFKIDIETGKSENILSNKSVNDLSISSSHIIVTTPQGGIFINRNGPYELQKYYSKSEGLISNEVAFATTFQDKYLFITREGVQLIDTARTSNTLDIDIYIDHPQLINMDTSILNDERELSFQVNKIDYINYPMDYYVSFSKADDSDDFQYSSSPNISYRNLNPGTYSLKVYGSNTDYNFRTPTLSKTIIIPPKMYETLLFRILAGLLVIGGLYVGLRYRFKKQQEADRAQLEIEKEYASIELQALQSQLNPHFVFNCLGSIQALITEKNTKDANIYLTKFSRLMRKFLEQSSEITISLAEEIETNRMYLDLEQLRFKEKLNYKITIDPLLEPNTIYIPAVLLQPFVENAIRHGLFHKEGSGNISLNFLKRNVDLVIELIDDGIGINAANAINAKSRFKHKSKGSKLIEKKTALLSIVEQIKFDISITDQQESENVAGTKVTIEFPGLLAEEKET